MASHTSLLLQAIATPLPPSLPLPPPQPSLLLQAIAAPLPASLPLPPPPPSLLSQAIATSLPPSSPSPPPPPPRQALDRIRFARKDPRSECSPNSTSKPITIPGQPAPELRLRDCWRPVPARVHDRLGHNGLDDEVGEYHLLGTKGWDFEQFARLQRERAEAGMVSAGSWRLLRTCSRKPTVVVRKDPDFSQDRKHEREVEERKEYLEKTASKREDAAMDKAQLEDNLSDAGDWEDIDSSCATWGSPVVRRRYSYLPKL